MFSVIFDMDGTLTDTQSIFIPAWDLAGENQGFNNVGRCIEYVCGAKDEEWQNYLIEHFEGVDIEKFKKDVADYIAKYGVSKLKPGVKEILDFLKENKIKMAIASGSPISVIERHLKATDIYGYFDIIVSGDEVANSKPAPDIFLLAAQRMGVEPKECFVFEDSSNGMKAGYAAGMKCIGVEDIAPFSQEVRETAFRLFDRIDEAISTLKEYF